MYSGEGNSPFGCAGNLVPKRYEATSIGLLVSLNAYSTTVSFVSLHR